MISNHYKTRHQVLKTSHRRNILGVFLFLFSINSIGQINVIFDDFPKGAQLIQRDNFNRKYSLMPANKQGFTWGYGDLEVFKNYIDRFKNQDKPRFDVFLTLSNHNPFQVNNQKYYENLFIKKN